MSKKMVAYFSASGVTAKAAKELAAGLGKQWKLCVKSFHRQQSWKESF